MPWATRQVIAKRRNRSEALIYSLQKTRHLRLTMSWSGRFLRGVQSLGSLLEARKAQCSLHALKQSLCVAKEGVVNKGKNVTKLRLRSPWTLQSTHNYFQAVCRSHELTLKLFANRFGTSERRYVLQTRRVS